MRENAHDKGRRMLAEGRLIVDTITDNRISARCRGDSAQIYSLGFQGGAWYCTCPASAARFIACSHVVALKLVTLEPS